MLLLLSCWIITGILAEDAAVKYYKGKNSSLCLHVRTPPPYQNGKWSFGKIFIAAKDLMNHNYKDKVVLYAENLTLCLKELTEGDAGVYTFTFYNSKYEEMSERHTVVLQETVPRPVITMSVLRSNRSAGLCSVAVNCSVHGNTLRSVCDQRGCVTSTMSFGGINVTLSVHNRTVVCSADNHISGLKASDSMATACFTTSHTQHKEAVPLGIWVMICVCAALVTVAAVVLKMRCSKSHCRRETSANQLILSQEAGAQPRRTLSGSSSSSEATYENMGVAQPGASHKVDASDGRRGETVQEASTEAAECPLHTSTVYSVLQRPKEVKSQHHQQVEQDNHKGGT